MSANIQEWDVQQYTCNWRYTCILWCIKVFTSAASPPELSAPKWHQQMFSAPQSCTAQTRQHQLSAIRSCDFYTVQHNLSPKSPIPIGTLWQWLFPLSSEPVLPEPWLWSAWLCNRESSLAVKYYHHGGNIPGWMQHLWTKDLSM